MTDLPPDIQELLDEYHESDLTEEESEELLLMCGHGIGPKLSSAAQKIVWLVGSKFTRKVIAAALRTVVDQVLPREEQPASSSKRIAWAQRQLTRAQILAIALELEEIK